LFDRSGLPLLLDDVELTPWGLIVRIAAVPDATAEALVDDYLTGLAGLNVLELLSARHPAGRVLGAVSVEVSDDVGTTYRLIGRPGACGPTTPWRWEWQFAPRPPSTSGQLTVHARDDGGQEVAVPVALAGPAGEGHAEAGVAQVDELAGHDHGLGDLPTL
jgi:hypothetical protein